MSLVPFNFDRFEVLYIIKGIMRNLTVLHVGTSSTSKIGEVDNPVLKIYYIEKGNIVKVPVIPGSTIKGIFRTFFESLARGQGEEVCDIFKTKDKKNLEKPCIACRVFGNQSLASHVYFFDALPKNIEKYKSVYTTRIGVSIDRFFGAARPGLLRTDEYVIPGIDWDFELRVFNLNLDSDSLKEARIFRQVLKYFVTSGLQFGGKRSTGAGLVRLVEGRVKKYVLKDGEFIDVLNNKDIMEWLGVKK